MENMQVYKNKNIKITWYVTLGLFVLFTIIGYKIGPNETAVIKSNVVNYGFNEIFINNSKATIYNYIGIISLGSFNLFNIITNGISIGYILKAGIAEFGLFTSILKFIPHAIFEVPAMIIGMSVGFLPITILISKAKKNYCPVKLTYYFKYVICSFIFVILLNLIAAIVEHSISMRF